MNIVEEVDLYVDEWILEFTLLYRKAMLGQKILCQIWHFRGRRGVCFANLCRFFSLVWGGGVKRSGHFTKMEKEKKQNGLFGFR